MSEKIRDIIIIGGGIASHTAALYTARAELQPLVIAGVEPDQLSTTSLVENYPGFPEGILGPELINNCKKQAEKFGAKYIEKKADAIKKEGNNFQIIAGEENYLTRTVIINTGASPRTLGIEGEKKYWGKGVSTCATCDATFYKNKTAAVIGGGDSAMEETIALSKFCTKVVVIHRRDEFRASKIMQKRILSLQKEGKVDIMYDTVPTEVLGDDKFVTGVKVKNVKTEEEKELQADGFFLAIGHTPNTKFLGNLIDLDDHGYIKTNRNQHTNVEGIYSAGDVQDHIYKQAITSAGTGCQCALEVEKYIENLKNQGKY